MKFTLLSAVILSIVLQFTQAFCVYNHLDDKRYNWIHVYDPAKTKENDRYFEKRMHSGEKECCNYSDKSCNESGLSEARLHLYVNHGIDNDEDRRSVYCSAGGAFEFTGNLRDGEVQFVCHNPDGTKETELIYKTSNPFPF